MGASYTNNPITPLTIFRLEEEGRHFHPVSREQYVEAASLYQPYGRPMKQTSEANKALVVAAGADFDGFLGITVEAEDTVRNFVARTGMKDLQVSFFDEIVTLFKGHGLITVGNGTEATSAKQLVGASITGGAPVYGDPIKFTAGKFELAVSTNVAWGTFIETISTGLYRIRIHENSWIVP